MPGVPLMPAPAPSRPAYPSDVTDAQWALLEPLIPPIKSGSVNGGRPARSRREIINSILYILRTGATWRQMPHDLVPWKTAHHYFLVWSKAGVWEKIHDALREKVRHKAGRDKQPSAAIVDAQSVKTTEKRGLCADSTPARRSRV
jgi:transposase